VKAQIREVKSNLSRFGDLAHGGQRVVVSKNGKPWFDLVPHRKKKRNIQPLKGVKATVTAEAATGPVDHQDIEGWT